jgi:PEGA domain-containing protein
MRRMTDPRDTAPHRPSYGWLVGLVAVLAAGLGGLVLVARLRTPARAERPNEPAEIDTSVILRPLETSADPATGERVAPFNGFAVSVETDPPGALVRVAGQERGEAPVFAGLPCAPGAPVDVRAEKPGFAPARATTTCRRDALVKLELRLVRAATAPAAAR